MVAGQNQPAVPCLLEPLEDRCLLSAIVEVESPAEALPGVIGQAVTIPMAPLSESASTVSCIDAGNRSGGGYFWSYRYHITMVPDDRVQLTLHIRLVGAHDNDDMARWEQGIEDVWSNRFALVDLGLPMPIMMDCVFVSSGADQTVTVLAGTGRSTMITWYSDDSALVAAHEAGHMIGLYDEYRGGGVHPTEPIYDATNIMGALTPGVYARHFAGVESWLEDQTGRDLLLLETLQSPALLSLHAQPEVLAEGKSTTLTARAGGVDPSAVSRVEFYRDANGNGVLDVATDTFLGRDTDATDGWTHDVNASDLRGGANTFLARARTADGQWSPSAATDVRVETSGRDLAVAIRPDLAFPASGKDGEWLSVPLQLANIGTATASGLVTLDIYASADTTRDAGDVLLKRETRAIHLGAGQDGRVDVTLILPGDIEPGDYHLLADINADGAMPEASLANNLAATAERYTFDPDRPLQFQPLDRARVARGENCRLEWTGGSSQTTLEVWTLGPAGWRLEQAGIDVSEGGFTWQGQAALLGAHSFVVRAGETGAAPGGVVGEAIRMDVLPVGAAPAVPAPAPEDRRSTGQSAMASPGGTDTVTGEVSDALSRPCRMLLPPPRHVADPTGQQARHIHAWLPVPHTTRARAPVEWLDTDVLCGDASGENVTARAGEWTASFAPELIGTL